MPQFSRILEEYRKFRTEWRPLVLATVVATEGSTYRKAGAVMLVDGEDAVAGLLSGGCLEGDLLLHAREVLATGLPRRVEYDLRPDHELIWGPATGCEGLSTIFLQRLNRTNEYAPLTAVDAARRDGSRLRLATVIARNGVVDANSGLVAWLGAAGAGASPGTSDRLARMLGTALESGSGESTGLGEVHDGENHFQVFFHDIKPAPRLLILGAGPDVPPVVRFAVELGWRVTVADHRPRYIENVDQFAPGVDLRLGRPAELERLVDLSRVDAAVIMSHHFDSDAEYLRTLLAGDPGYIGLLGPARRRDKLLEHIGCAATDRLRSPIGLDLGGTIPEAIALAIVAEIQAFLGERSGRSLGHSREAGHAGTI